jgi:hypothetical protein
MSHTAIVAIKDPVKNKDNETYRLHTSKNGGERFYLHKKISALNRDDNVITQLRNEPYNTPNIATGSNKDSHASKNKQLIDEDPVATNVSFGELINRRIDYLGIDVLYLVDEYNDVDTYYLSWAAPLLQKIIGDSISIEVYPNTIRSNEDVKSTTPDFTLDKNDFLTPSKVAPNRPDTTIRSSDLLTILLKTHTSIAHRIVAMSNAPNENMIWKIISIATLRLKQRKETMKTDPILDNITSGVGIYVPLHKEGSREKMWRETREQTNKITWNNSLKHTKKFLKEDGNYHEITKQHNKEFGEKHRIYFTDTILSKDIRLA